MSVSVSVKCAAGGRLARRHGCQKVQKVSWRLLGGGSPMESTQMFVYRVPRPGQMLA